MHKNRPFERFFAYHSLGGRGDLLTFDVSYLAASGGYLPSVMTGRSRYPPSIDKQAKRPLIGAASLYDLPFLYAGVFFLRFGLNSSGQLGAILHLRVRSRSRYRPPSLATRHADGQSDANTHD